MSYCINVSHLERETVVSVEITGLSEEFRSVKISQFQCIGWLLGIFDHAERLAARTDGLINPEYDQEALERVARLSPDEATRLLELKTLTDRFQYVWEIIGEHERKTAKIMDFRYYDNFWLGFEAYSLIWNPSPPPNPDQKPPLQ
ncbi:hypothetical protein [Pseudomonas sp. URMO17WK12:I12]|uniref:hypothetical protein n=1 Tax=Pseudomonas sp. URMO17WK12:I12 TaxID=1259797 RepID=UPI000488C0D4|nr:hypothetical protein [Pseudomonas sp. URMO17WK12:I12]